MIIRFVAAWLIIAVMISGCTIYRDYPFEYYERSGPRNRMEFIMEDGTIHYIESNHIAMMKNSQDYYTIYFKNDQKLVLRKDQITSVKMLDEARSVGMYFAIGAVSALIIIGGFIWFLHYAVVNA